MAIVYAKEEYPDVIDEAVEFLFYGHWDEVAQNKETVPLDPDFEAFKRTHDQGIMRVVTARDDGRLVGYWSGFVRGHLHYKSTKMAFTDIYYILPEYRARCARGMFKFLHKTLKGEGVVRLHNRSKLENINSAGRFLEMMGYELVEYGYSILL